MFDNTESGPIHSDDLLSNKDNEDKRLLLTAAGSTCHTYKLFRGGKFHFLKVLKQELMDDDYYHELYSKEFEAGKRLNCEYFPRYEELQCTDTEVSIMMEYIDGESLAQRLERQPDWFADSHRLSRFLTQLLTALKALHTQQLLHLDLKPSNILLTTVNDDVRIIDLGYCHTDNAPFTEGRTTAFAAPEQLLGKDKLTARTDVYAVGRIMQCIDKHTPLPSHLRHVMQQALNEDVSMRYASAEEMQRDMDQPKRRSRWIWVLGCGLLILLAGMIWQKHKDTTGDEFETVLRDKYVLHLRVLSHDSLTACIIAAPDNQCYHKEIYVPEAVIYKGETYTITAVGDSAFMGCNDLYTLYLPATVHSIGDDAFRDCHQLRTMTLPVNLQSIGEYVFASDTTLESVTLPPSLHKVPRGCFVDCYHLTQVLLPNTIEVIEQDAFVSCLNLKELHLPDSLQHLERGVFYNCRSLQKITLPASLKSIGVYAFMECPNLQEINFLSPEPPNAANVFDRNDIRICVPEGSKEEYKQRILSDNTTL